MKQQNELFQSNLEGLLGQGLLGRISIIEKWSEVNGYVLRRGHCG